MSNSPLNESQLHLPGDLIEFGCGSITVIRHVAIGRPIVSFIVHRRHPFLSW